MDDAAAQRNAAQLDELVEDTSSLSATLKKRVKALEAQKGSGRDGQIRKQQVSLAMLCIKLFAHFYGEHRLLL
jgi:syntaxin 1B/2/3